MVDQSKWRWINENNQKRIQIKGIRMKDEMYDGGEAAMKPWIPCVKLMKKIIDEDTLDASKHSKILKLDGCNTWSKINLRKRTQIHSKNFGKNFKIFSNCCVQIETIFVLFCISWLNFDYRISKYLFFYISESLFWFTTWEVNLILTFHAT